MRDHYYFPDAISHFTEPFILNPEKPKTCIFHSYGGLLDRMAKNALSHLSLKHDINYHEHTHSLVFGTFPIWGSEERPREKKRQSMSGVQSAASLFIIAAEDLIAFTPDYAKNAMLDAAKKGIENPHHLFTAYHHPNNENKVLVILSPGIVPPIANNKVNFIKHGFAHYVEATGINRSRPLGINNLEDTRLQQAALQSAILSLMDHQVSARDRTLAEELGATPLDKEQLRGLKIGHDHYITSGIIALMQESEHWKKAGFTDHPFLGGSKPGRS